MQRNYAIRYIIIGFNNVSANIYAIIGFSIAVSAIVIHEYC